MRNLISALDLERGEYEEIFDLADRYIEQISRKRRLDKLDGRVIALAFFEPSTRTALSFASAALRLGGEVIGFSSEDAISIAKGESLADTIRMLDSYADCIVIRHRYDGSARFASEISGKPVVNAGDGKHEHPTQAILDLYTVKKTFGYVDNLVFGVLGDLRYARVVNSLLRALTRFKPRRVYLISPPQLRARREILDGLNYPYVEISDPRDAISSLDVLYVTRVQRERFPDDLEYRRVRQSYRVDPELVSMMSRDSIVLHPLPRVDEVDRGIDKYPQARYFEQASYGVPVRMAVLSKVLGVA